MDIFDLSAKITVDSSEYENGLNSASEKTATFGDKMKGGLATAGKLVGAGLAAAAAGVSALVKSSVESYANYEQLVGGVETLFGDSANVVMSYAENAFKTAGLSANEYMETVTSFSASLLQSLGGDTAKAADYADMAIRDMSDNANKMGTDMTAIQNAYQGFAKQNYTMLDNLKLGYGGTKTEMERLIEDAEKLDSTFKAARDENGELAMSYADIVQAIHIVQDNMGITGTTAKEAASTIQGSANMMKSAWENMITGIADDNADFGKLIENLTDSVATFAGNIIPRISTALQGVGQLVVGLAPVISAALPEMINTMLPSLLESASTLLMTLVQALIDNLPMLFEVATQFALTLANGLVEALPVLLPQLVEVVLAIVDGLISNIDLLIDAAIAIIFALADGLIAAQGTLMEKAPELVISLVEAIIRNAPKLLGAALELILQLVTGIVDGFDKLVKKGSEIVDQVKKGFKEKIDQAKEWGQDLIENFVEGITARWRALKEAVAGVAQTVKNFLGFSEPELGPLSNFHTYAPDMMELFAKGIRDNEDMLKNTVADAFDFGIPEITAKSSINTSHGSNGAATESPITIIVQSVLDGRIIGETAYKYQRNMTRARAL